MWRCPKCQRQNSDMDKFCSNCRTAKQGTLNKSVLLCLAMCVLGIIIIICSLGSCGDKGGTESTYKPTTNSVSTPRPTNKVVSTPKPTVKPAPTPKPTAKPVATPVPTATPVTQKSVYELAVSCGDEDVVWIPNEKAVLKEYATKYVRSGDPDSVGGKYVVFTYKDVYADHMRSYTVEEGSKVTVVARCDAMSLCYYQATDGSYRMGWIWTEWLSSK